MKTDFSTVSSKGQLAIPARLRRKHGIKKGTRVSFIEEQGKLILQPLTPEFVRSLCGSVKGKRSALDILLAERRRERKL